MGVIREIARILENEPPIEHVEAGGGDVVQGGTCAVTGSQMSVANSDEENRKSRRQEACSPTRIEAQKRKRPVSISAMILFVIRKPETTKKTSTPMKPPGTRYGK